MSLNINNKLVKYKYKTKHDPDNVLYQNKLNYYLMLNLKQTGGKQETSCGFVIYDSDDMFENNKRLEKMGTNTDSFVAKNKINKEQIYSIHDNGGTPFKVTVNKKEIVISTYDEKKLELLEEKVKKIVEKEESENSTDNAKCYDVPYDVQIMKINDFLGLWTGFDTSFFNKNGNSLLIQITKTKYVYVGEHIFSFETDEEITDFIACMGNNDVPYTVAYSENYVYFLINHDVVHKKYIQTVAIAQNASQMYDEYFGEIYKYYSRNCKKNENKEEIPICGQKMKKYKIIQKRL